MLKSTNMHETLTLISYTVYYWASTHPCARTHTHTDIEQAIHLHVICVREHVREKSLHVRFNTDTEMHRTRAMEGSKYISHVYDFLRTRTYTDHAHGPRTQNTCKWMACSTVICAPSVFFSVNNFVIF